MKLSTSGALFDGKRFFALAELDKKDEIISGDTVVGNLLLTTAVDGSLSTTAKFVSERVVCNNTLTVALNENSKNLVKVVHSAEWDADQAKIDLGLVDASWHKFITDMRKLADIKVTNADAKKYVQSKFYNPGLNSEEQSSATYRKVDDIMLLLNRGAGADLAKGTAWGVVNAFTNYYTHGNGRKRDASRKFWAAYYDSDKIKQTVVNDMLALG
jgi:phage/plasmid-like protein (TIGR03299 family)